MRINEITWLESVVDKLASKHSVEPDEVEEVIFGKSRFFFVQKGTRYGEDVYMSLGRTDGGRYMTVLFIFKTGGNALILSARDMANAERKRYERK